MSSDYVPHARSTQQQPIVSQVDLSFDEVANLFPFPIAEAASTLGVSTNDLKRVCRENGLNRWPYRKILAGKTVEDVKKEAAREMAILERMSRLQPQSTVNTSNAPRSNKPGTYNIAGPAGSIPTEKDISNSDLLKRQVAGPAVGLYAHASSLKPLNIDQRTHLPNQFQLRINVPTYLDEFRQGFPSKGLSSSSTQWWGNSSNEKNDQAGVQQGHKDEEASTGQHESQSTEEHRGGCIDDNSRNEATNAGELTPASMLTRTRKHAIETGKKALGLSITRGYGAFRLADKDEAILRAIFTEGFPSLWEASTAS